MRISTVLGLGTLVFAPTLVLAGKRPPANAVRYDPSIQHAPAHYYVPAIDEYHRQHPPPQYEHVLPSYHEALNQAAASYRGRRTVPEDDEDQSGQHNAGRFHDDDGGHDRYRARALLVRALLDELE
ncbi:uncharacterized protein FIBRA_04825 [Fibroporia radiculosa]|uniref:Uncharacterized protein n=1 Tax=Fibroporia radiculosa TaxID=599839 RepID=J4G808_9APHY|nr:uncharacterized protein FIBRA_04825 [Fibroporia radiculosa]CCM02718.1 predicted protein [Fibroporia radiculosa]